MVRKGCEKKQEGENAFFIFYKVGYNKSGEKNEI